MAATRSRVRGSALIGAVLLVALAGVIASVWWSWAPCRGEDCEDSTRATVSGAATASDGEPAEVAVARTEPEPAEEPEAADDPIANDGGEHRAADPFDDGPAEGALDDVDEPIGDATVAGGREEQIGMPETDASASAARDGAAPPDSSSSDEAAVAPPAPNERRTTEPAPTKSIATRDLSGWWMLSNEVQSTSHSPYRGLRLGYRVRLDQRGERLVGEGEKRWENGVALPPSRRTPISFEGRRDGESVSLRFTESGARRTSRGVFTLHLAPDGKQMAGSFSSTAASSAGTSIARRVD